WENAARLAAHLLEDKDVQASSINDIEQHFNFSGKNCPSQLRAGKHGLSWDKFLNNVQKFMRAEEPIMAGMTSPEQGKVSSEYGRRSPIPGVTSGTLHAGIDIANKTGTPVYAAFAGTVVSTGVNGVPGRSGRYILISNPDGERQYYGHLNKSHVKAGQKIKQGQHIGDMGATGNVTGPHLHFEIWRNSSHTSHRNPRIDFNHFGIAPGSKPKVSSTAPKPSPKPKPKPSPGLSTSDKKAIQRALARMGYDVGPADGVYGDRTTREVMNYQRDLNHYAGAGLVVDGGW